MSVTFYKTADQFINAAGTFLLAHEAEHNFILSTCKIAMEKAARGEKADIPFVTMQNEAGDVTLAALLGVPNNLILSRTAEADMTEFAKALIKSKIRIPGVVGPSDVAGSFINEWVREVGQEPVEYMDQIIYTLQKVQSPATPAKGKLRLALPAEQKTIAAWMADFSKQALPKFEHLNDDDAQKKAELMIATKRLYVWDVNGVAVAQTVVSGTNNVARLNMVYTPEEHRGHGYASTLVSSLSQMQLDLGKSVCCLYANARNPVSNSIYRKIGYEFVGRSSYYLFARV